MKSVQRHEGVEAPSMRLAARSVDDADTCEIVGRPVPDVRSLRGGARCAVATNVQKLTEPDRRNRRALDVRLDRSRRTPGLRRVGEAILTTTSSRKRRIQSRPTVNWMHFCDLAVITSPKVAYWFTGSGSR